MCFLGVLQGGQGVWNVCFCTIKLLQMQGMSKKTFTLANSSRLLALCLGCPNKGPTDFDTSQWEKQTPGPSWRVCSVDGAWKDDPSARLKGAHVPVVGSWLIIARLQRFLTTVPCFSYPPCVLAAKLN